MKQEEFFNIQQYFDLIEKMPPDFKLFYQKVICQRLTRSSHPVITPEEFNVMHRKYPDAFIVTDKAVEVKPINKLPAKMIL